jgi:GT2 family glycosyltransferase
MTESSGVPTISVVVATTGRPENVAHLVPLVLADPSVRHLVVVVDGEDDRSMAVLSSLQRRLDRLVFTQIPHSGQLVALELGVHLSDADVVLLLDDDVVPAPDLAARHAQGHRGSVGLVLVGAMPVQLPSGRADVASLLYARDYLTHCAGIEAGEHQVLDRLWLGNISLRRSDCLAIGLHSGDFTASYHADQDLGFRLAEAGLVGRYDPSLDAVHRHRRTGVAFLRDARRRGAGVAHLHQVHPRLGPFDPSMFTEDLPPMLAAIVRRVGSTSVATGSARVLLALASCSRALGWQSARVSLAQVARRIMFVHGATRGEERQLGLEPLAPAGSVTREVRRTPLNRPVPLGPIPEPDEQLAAR